MYLGGSGAESDDGEVTVVATFSTEGEVNVSGRRRRWGDDSGMLFERGIVSNKWCAV